MSLTESTDLHLVRKTWLRCPPDRQGVTKIFCAVCARESDHRNDYTALAPHVCWDCRATLITNKALCGDHVVTTLNGLSFTDGTWFLGCFVAGAQ